MECVGGVCGRVGWVALERGSTAGWLPLSSQMSDVVEVRERVSFELRACRWMVGTSRGADQQRVQGGWPL